MALLCQLTNLGIELNKVAKLAKESGICGMSSMSMAGDNGSHSSHMPVEVASKHKPKTCTLGPTTCMVDLCTR